jgi:hypothetical protein
MARGILLVDEQGRRWKVWLRAALQGKYRTGKQILDAKQRHADQERARGNGAVADSIERHSIHDWMSGQVFQTAMLTRKVRVDDKGREVR